MYADRTADGGGQGGQGGGGYGGEQGGKFPSFDVCLGCVVFD